jgi:hypothetical protein
MYDHLRGSATPFVDESGQPTAGVTLKRALATEGLGEHQLTFTGLLLPPNATDRSKLKPWTVTMTTLGTLDPDGLARLSHAAARQAIVSGTRRKDTPPELYLTGITIDSPGVAPEPPAETRRRIEPVHVRAVRAYVGKPLKSGKRRVVYRDRSTGKFVSRATWERRRKR